MASPRSEQVARQDLADQGVEEADIAFSHRARLRTVGSDTTIEVDVGPPQDMRVVFETLHRKRFGYIEDEEPVVEALWVEAVARTSHALCRPIRIRLRCPDHSGRRLDCLSPCCSGRIGRKPRPALILEASSTTVVESGWRAERASDGTLILTRAVPLTVNARSAPTPTRCGSKSSTICSWPSPRMGVALQSTATSVNIKERLDFSCAIFDRDGALINAPHIPRMHLGSMGESIRTIIETRGGRARRTRDQAGRRICAERPYRGGRICPTSRLSSRSSTATRSGRPPSSRRAATMPTSAGSRPVPCRQIASRSPTREC